MFKRTILSSCLLLTILLLISKSILIRADDAAEGEDKAEEASQTENEQLKKDAEVEDGKIGPSTDAQTTFLFTSHATGNRELVAGKIVKFLIGFSNRGEKDFIIKSCDTSFRYPLDFSYHIQNFSAVRYERLVQPKQEATFDYAFIPSDGFIGRPLGMVVNLHYVDADGSTFVSSVFNETVTIVEDEASFQTETYFLYLVLLCIVVLILLIAQHFLSKFTRKSAPTYQKSFEMGTNKNEVDYEWIPRSHLEQKKSPKLGSPRNRKSVKANS